MDKIDFFKIIKKFITSSKNHPFQAGLINCEICNIKLEQVDEIKI